MSSWGETLSTGRPSLVELPQATSPPESSPFDVYALWHVSTLCLYSPFVQLPPCFIRQQSVVWIHSKCTFYHCTFYLYLIYLLCPLSLLRTCLVILFSLTYNSLHNVSTDPSLFTESETLALHCYRVRAAFCIICVLHSLYMYIRFHRWAFLCPLIDLSTCSSCSWLLLGCS